MLSPSGTTVFDPSDGLGDPFVWATGSGLPQKLDTPVPILSICMKCTDWSGSAVDRFGSRTEFSMWSATLSEIGVRPQGISWPVGTERYERRIMVALDVVHASLCQSTHHDDLWTRAPVPVSSVTQRVRTRLAVGSG